MGLIPYWSKDAKISYRTINARMESIDTAPSFRDAFKRRRCLIPADGFYEWKKVHCGRFMKSSSSLLRDALEAPRSGPFIPIVSLLGVSGSILATTFQTHHNS